MSQNADIVEVPKFSKSAVSHLNDLIKEWLCAPFLAITSTDVCKRIGEGQGEERRRRREFNQISSEARGAG